ncbi:hypothetical protein A3B21_00185 [Candidatus Uhrbacteria bacterium RIFCSPLOWO2_01_FULL_47_24]|uniref:Methyltransferase type 11 domain-containing protein n=1 Tax=Candidatus Uhrbacteria bacterium RIFCSPLOWO2_01_FULL_47_24 TaxID=1802401 RepID=A0A1F7USV0_9BACT|nr:MAG: hypothetical protein A2753_01235 [Candidatus Uhrbacteria bacterium RIFCSPHIGHO2_01_FULL_47_11]OGL68015.1 MAG: hypothetical protein A3D58_01560 [Candidatus Uhrbacteria bacterium RIFCSPHIGHO2_02_FULL_46_47]OGL75425.1 MAG: hypothetical protein A3F52_04905 [Candidatus Uhrbacteria bacterium RIFCSPHIGHO2_12_FULL_47_11]OGL81329.1 MAG: hypothetical protein A3B21_00185 [Candidatus Uhrbacteria bacterium RIFCSPLOWO2_01_FULL_47_24]OGL83927.1 MAG: hypothetical protein A3J03_00720 [Candidatus Uhrbact
MLDTPFPDKYLDDISGDPSANYFTPIWDEVCAEVSFSSILDIGCGNGLFTTALKKRFPCTLFGVDGSTYALEGAKKSGFDDVRLVKDLSSQSLPFLDGKFDMIVCKDVLEHLLDPEYLVSEMVRVVKVGGYLLVQVPNHFSLYGRLRFLFTNNIDTWHYYVDSDRWNFPHVKFYTHKDFLEMFRKYNCVLLKDFSHYFLSIPKRRYLPKALDKKISLFLTRRWPSQFAQGFTILVQKQ